MFCAVDANQHKFVFHGKSGNFVGIESHTDLPSEKFLKGEPAGKIAQRSVVVQLDDEFRIRHGEKILAGNFSGVNGAERDRRHEAEGAHHFRGAANVLLTNEQVQVAIGAHRRVTIGLHRQYWPFYDQSANSFRGEAIEDAKKLRSQSQCEEHSLSLAIGERLPYFGRDQRLFKITKARGQMASHAMFLREDKQTRPIRGAEQACKPLAIVRWRSALEQRRPFVPQRSDAGQMRRGYRLGHSDPRLA